MESSQWEDSINLLNFRSEPTITVNYYV